MDPCSNSSPSHSFKGFRSDVDRPLRSGGGGSIRLKDQNRTAASPPPSSSQERDNDAGFSSSFRVLIDQDANDDEDVETRETKLWRGFRSKCFRASCSDKDDVACDESSERGRSSLRRKAPGHEKFISMKTLASERERPDGTRKLSDSDRESLDRFNTMRLSVGRRSRGNDHHRRQATPEHSNNSLLREESDHAGFAGMVVCGAARKESGFDKKSGSDGGGNESSVGRDLFWKGSPGSQEEHSATIRDESDIQRGSSILNRNEAKIPAKGSPRRDYGLDKNGTRTLLKEKNGAGEQRIPLKKAFKTLTEMEDELVDKGLPNSKGLTVSREPEQGVNSGEIDTRTWSRRSSSKTSGGGLDDVKDGNSSQANGNNEDWRGNIHDFLFKFSHITKRVRSERDRGRREELANKRVQREDRGDKLEAAGTQKVCSVEKQDMVAAAEVDEATNGINLDTEARAEGEADAGVFSKNADVTVLQSEERESDRLEDPLVPGSSSTQVEKVEREGNLDSEEPYTIRLSKARAVDIGGGKEGKNRDNEAPVDTTVGEEACEGVNQEAFEVERQKNRDGVASYKVPAEFHSVGELGEPKMMGDMEEKHWGTNEEKTNLQVQFADGIASTSIALERHESLKGGLTLDFPEKGTLEKEKHAKQDCADKGFDSSKELTLSLFMKPAAAKAEGSELKGHAIEIQSGLDEEFESGKHLQSARSMQARKSQHGLGGFSEGVSDHSAYGHKQKKLKMESLQLSLALPGTSMAAAGSNHPHAAGSAEPERSFQSLRHTQTQTENLSQSKTHTNSDGFTTSLSFSQSHSFIHNPSCSLNCTSLENQELSCGGSRQLSQGNEQLSQRSWQTASGNEQMLNGTLGFTSLSQDKSKHRRRIPLYQRVLQNGNMQSSPSVTGSNRSSGNNHVSHRSHHSGQKLQVAPKILDSSSQDLEDAGRPDSTRNDFPVRFHQQEAAWLASNQPAAQETRSESQAQWEGERDGDYFAPPAKRYSSVRSEGVIGGRNVLREIIGLYEIATEPIAVMAQKMQELPDNFLEGLKGLAKEVLGSFEKREEFITLQDKIRKRMDLTEHTLLHAHRTQLEILVAFKTGMQVFVQEGTKPHTYKVLTEIFLQTRCRNIACQQALPVYGCECRICSQKSGFCHDCMCVVCFKFDSDNSTCRWVGCDVCMHWCHTDCGLRLSYIAPAQSIQGAAGTTEMQFRCVACDHHSELFGFVKAVFHKCANSWGAETLTKELDCVRRIFHGSEDTRGKQLCWKAEEMLHKLENNVETAEVRRSMLRFLNGGNAELDGACTGAKKGPPPSKPNEGSDRTASAAREATFQVASSVGNKLANLDKARVSLQTNDRKLAEKRTETADLHYDRARKRAEIEEIESVVRMKQAEAKMFQVRADEAHQEASGLQRIISVKQEKIEEDFTCKYAKLRLNEAEEKKRKRLEELQALERAELDYQKMKLRMEAQIKDLLMKMELTKRQYA